MYTAVRTASASGWSKWAGTRRAEDGGRPPAVGGAQGEPEGPNAQPRTTGSEIAGELGQGGEANGRPIGPHTGTVQPRSADHTDSPCGCRSRPRYGEGVVAQQVDPRPAPQRDGGSQVLLVHREVDPGQAVDAHGAQRERWVVDPGVVGRGGNGRTEFVDGRVETDQLMVARAHTGAAEQGAVLGDEYRIGLGAASVEGQDRRLGIGAHARIVRCRTWRQGGSVGITVPAWA